MSAESNLLLDIGQLIRILSTKRAAMLSPVGFHRTQTSASFSREKLRQASIAQVYL
jgi:hypothetical protein